VKRCPNCGCVKVGMLQRDDVRAGGRVVEVAERMPAKWLNSFDQLGRKEARVGLPEPTIVMEVSTRGMMFGVVSAPP
jgi:hypothetical protein